MRTNVYTRFVCAIAQEVLLEDSYLITVSRIVGAGWNIVHIIQMLYDLRDSLYLKIYL